MNKILVYCFRCGENTDDIAMADSLCENCEHENMRLVLVSEINQEKTIGEVLSGVAARSQT